jgi:hypothetical protein
MDVLQYRTYYYCITCSRARRANCIIVPAFSSTWPTLVQAEIALAMRTTPNSGRSARRAYQILGGWVRRPLTKPDHRWRAGSPDSDGGRRLRGCRSAGGAYVEEGLHGLPVRAHLLSRPFSRVPDAKFHRTFCPIVASDAGMRGEGRALSDC